MLLRDKVVLITGSTTGIGRSIARLCLAEGARVMIHGRNEQRARELCAEFNDQQAAYVIADLMEADLATMQGLVDATVKQFGRIDSLINNAGRSPRHTIDDVTPDQFDAIIRLNLRAPLFLTQAAVRAFRQQKTGGTVVNIGSINAYCGQADLLAYSITKGGLMTLTRNLGNALGKEKIRINQLNVGWTVTENESQIKQGEGFPHNWEEKIPLTYAPSGRLLRPEEVAQHAVFWASDVSAPANGVVCELEQYPIVGRNLINELPLDVFK